MLSIPLPPNWEQRIDPNSGAIFYANVVTRESTWERPLPTGYTPTELPPNWEERLDPNSGKVFYYNKATKVTQWEKPNAAEASSPLPSVPPPPTSPAASDCTQKALSRTSSNRSVSSSNSQQQQQQQQQIVSTKSPAVPRYLNDSSIKKYKMVVVGDGAVGKTCLLICYIRKEFCSDYVPTVFDNKTISVTHNSATYPLSVWDTAGQEEYDRLRPLSYPGADCFLMCFSVMTKNSLDNCRIKWKTELKHYCPNAKIILVGTKKDLRGESVVGSRPVTAAEAIKTAKELDCVKYMECSAKTNDGITEIFDEVIEQCIHPETKKQKKKCIIL